MAVERPKWCPVGTVISERGWVNPKTGELLASRKFTAEEVTEWKKAHGLQRKSPTKKVASKKATKKATKKKATKKATKKKVEVFQGPDGGTVEIETDA